MFYVNFIFRIFLLSTFQVLEAASKCYECLCSEEYAIGGKCDVAKKTLVDNLVSKFKESMQDFFAEASSLFLLLTSLFWGFGEGGIHVKDYVSKKQFLFAYY